MTIHLRATAGEYELLLESSSVRGVSEAGEAAGDVAALFADLCLGGLAPLNGAALRLEFGGAGTVLGVAQDAAGVGLGAVDRGPRAALHEASGDDERAATAHDERRDANGNQQDDWVHPGLRSNRPAPQAMSRRKAASRWSG